MEGLTKELLSEVLDIDINTVDIRENIIVGWDTSITPPVAKDFINIYELMHKCKEFAFRKYGESISSHLMKDGWYATTTKYYELTLDGFYADSEPEAVFKATSYIMEQLKQKD